MTWSHFGAFVLGAVAMFVGLIIASCRWANQRDLEKRPGIIVGTRKADGAEAVMARRIPRDFPAACDWCSRAEMVCDADGMPVAAWLCDPCYEAMAEHVDARGKDSPER